MTGQKQDIYEFHNFQLDIGKSILLRENQAVNLQWKTFELLCIFVKSGGNLLTREMLMDELWADTFVEDNNLSQHIRALRKSLGENGNASEKFIETVAGRGYRFLPEVQIVRTAVENEAPARSENGVQFSAEDSSKKTVSLPLTDTELSPDSYISGSKNSVEIIAYSAPQTFEVPNLKTEAIGEETSRRSSVVNQETPNQPETIDRPRGFRRGLKSLLWGAGAGFVFSVLFRVLQISSGALYQYQNTLPAETPRGLTDMFGGFLNLLLVPVKACYFIGIGLIVFGIARMIYSSFEKKSPKLEPSFFERWISVIIISVIATVAIPNLIASYRAAKELRQKQSLPDNLTPSSKPPEFLNFSTAKYQKIIENQQGQAAISPNGKFIVYTSMIAGKQALWLRQLATNTNIQILPPNEADYRGISFSPDSEYVYFNHKNTLYRVSVLGGEATLILKEIEGFSLSPDDTQIVFNRRLPDYRCGLFISKTNGSEERMIAERQAPDCYKTAAWSPDGKLIAFAAGQSDTGDANTRLLAFRIADGMEIPLSDERWFHIHSLVWMPDQGGIILSGRKKLNEENPLWQINYPGGETRQLTEGLTRFAHLSLTADGKHLLASQTILNTYLSIAPANASSEFRRLDSAFYGLTWLPDGKIVYSSHINNDNLWMINSDGTEHRQLTFGDAGYLNPVASSDGRYIFYTLAGGVQHIWRMNADGSDKIQLTDGGGEQKPNVSSDGQWLF